MNETMQQVIVAVKENRRRFEEFCLSLSAEEAIRPVPDSNWVVKDFAAHLDTLDSTLVRYLEHVASGGQMDMTKTVDGAPFDLDGWNDAEVAARRDWPMARVFAEARANRERVFEAIERLTDDDIDRNMHFSDPKRGSADFPLKLFLTGWAQHDPAHVADMIKALSERASDPEIVAWLGNPFVQGYQAGMSAPQRQQQKGA